MFILRVVSSADLDLVCHHREAMFRDSGREDAVLDAMAAPFRAWLAPRLVDGRYFGFIAEVQGEPVGGVGMMEIEWPPHPLHPTEDRRGYVLNVFVEPLHRKQGIARALMTAAEDEFRRRGISYAILHATAKGMPLYEQGGWLRTSEMAKLLKG